MFSQTNPENLLKRGCVSVAAAGTTQANAAAVTAPYTLVTGADGTKGVILPATKVTNPTNRDAGAEIVLTNTSASALPVYPASGGTINGGSANASLSVAAGKTVTLRCTTVADTWWSQVG